MGNIKHDEKGLAIQELEKLNGSLYDGEELHTNHPVVISRQATINVGTIGHVAHGKSTVVKALTNVSTIRSKLEKERNLTIRLGYANAKVYKCDDADLDEKKRFTTEGSAHPDNYKCEFSEAGKDFQVVRHMSFVDCPGHDVLMATMLNGAAVMDAALLLVAGNEHCPQPQTMEHLAAVEIMRLKHLIILQNKVELVKPEAAIDQQKQIREFVGGTVAAEAPIIPISAVLRYNIDILAQYLCTQIPVPIRDFKSDPFMMVIRSFDVNKPGEEIEKLKGGVAGGSIIRGILRRGDEIEVRPGHYERKESGGFVCRPLKSKIVHLMSEQNELQFAVPGGLIGVGTQMDPAVTKDNGLVGMVLGLPGRVPEVYHEVEIKFYLLKKLLGIKNEEGKSMKVKKLNTGEILNLNVGSCQTSAKVLKVKDAKEDRKDETAKVEFTNPVCLNIGDKVAISRRIEKQTRLIGWGMVVKGSTLDLTK